MQANEGPTAAPPAGASPGETAALAEGLAKIALEAPPEPLHAVARLRNYFLTGVVIAGPIALTLYIAWHTVNAVDAWVRPFLPGLYDLEAYLPFPVPGIGLVFVVVALTFIGAVAAHLFGRSLFSAGGMMLARLPIVRNVHRGLHDIFASVFAATSQDGSLRKVALVQFPSEGIWSLAFITGEAAAAIKQRVPDEQLISVFIAHGLLPPSGITCFVPRKDVIPISMSIEDAAKIIFSAGLAHPTPRRRQGPQPGERHD